MDRRRRKSKLSPERVKLLDRLLVAAAVGWVVAVTVALWMPPPPVVIPNLWLDKATHFAMFAGVGGLWRWVSPRTWTVTAFAVFLGALTEVGQGWWPWGRYPDVMDFAADAVGALAGVGVAAWIPVPWRRAA